MIRSRAAPRVCSRASRTGRCRWAAEHAQAQRVRSSGRAAPVRPPPVTPSWSATVLGSPVVRGGRRGQHRARPQVGPAARPAGGSPAEVVPPVEMQCASSDHQQPGGAGQLGQHRSRNSGLFNRSGLTSSSRSCRPALLVTSSHSSVFAEFTVAGLDAGPGRRVDLFRIRGSSGETITVAPCPGARSSAVDTKFTPPTCPTRCAAPTSARRPCATSAVHAATGPRAARRPAGQRPQRASASARNALSVLARSAAPRSCPIGEAAPGQPRTWVHRARPAGRRAGRARSVVPAMSGGTREPTRCRDVAPQGAREPAGARRGRKGAVRPRKVRYGHARCATCTGTPRCVDPWAGTTRSAAPGDGGAAHHLSAPHTHCGGCAHPQRVFWRGQLKRLRPTISFMICGAAEDGLHAGVRNALAIGYSSM